MKNPGEIYRDDPFFPPDQDLSAVAFQRIAPYSEAFWHFYWNKDEKKVKKYTLPPIVSKTAAEWEKKERPATLQLFKDFMYGIMPPGPDRLRLEQLSLKENALNNTAIRKEIRIHCDMNNGRHRDFDLLLYVPKHLKKPAPVFLGLNFNGNHSVTPEPDVRLTRAFKQVHGDWMVPHTEAERGEFADRWCIEAAMERGYAVAAAANGEIFPDHPNGLCRSVFALFGEPADLRPDFLVPFQEQKAGWIRRYGGLAAWSWGLSRMLDALEQEPLVDARKAAVLGHSRNGKAALWAGACDPRFAMVISNCSGCAGASLSRRTFGESLKLQTFEDPAWLCGRVIHYLDRVDELPVDQHQLLALIAPRHLYVVSGTGDPNADPKGEFLSAREASKVWQLYGMKGVGRRTMPKPDTPVGYGVRYHIHNGPHRIGPWDWEQYYNYADEVFGKPE